MPQSSLKELEGFQSLSLKPVTNNSMTEKCSYCDRPMQHKHMLLLKNDIVVPDDAFETKSGKGNPFGWSQYELWSGKQFLGWIESGEPSLTDDAKALGYSIKIEEFTPKP